ncbi:TatD DNase family protein [Ignavibacterium album JCM 16511]|uniref:TatD DNase family protein n=1 Tax=Ignavibacterium album (strain DSM 19864 / JCM 16511 / NBRC 101810 / Mat9-16) TaxID=945713 RepID=I0AIN8_IGNAJ|nr:TatD family hydrolase [Ignavibacterium album]AFH48845.1 TatD DNase family protein [Ignavibacterium album JCM 16511]
MFVDTHAHLFYENFKDDFDDVITRAKENGVDFILVPSTDIKTAEETLKLSDKYDFIYAAVGIHPHDTKDWDDSLLTKIDHLAKHPKVVAIGEIGLDYYYDFSPKTQQIKAFRSQIELALKLNLPVIIHNRDSDEDMMEIISSYCSTGLKVQFHCFNASLSDAIEYMKMNHFISFTGNITFKKSDELRNILKHIDLNHLLLETDSPFMTPVPYRGKRNEPAFVKLVAEKIAEVHNTSVEDIAKITSLNAFRMFGIGSQPKVSFTYKLGNSLYINVTNRCNADCVFCRRKEDPFLRGYNLGMTKSEEPSAEVYIKEIGDPKKYDEIVFCGYGEPTIRWNVVKEVAKYVKEKGGKTRLNTNGHGNFINHRDITPEMKGLIDVVSISFNSFNPKQYAEIMRVDELHFYEMLDFAKKCKLFVEKVVMTVVDFDEIEIDKAKKVVEEEIGAEFRVRHYF